MQVDPLHFVWQEAGRGTPFLNPLLHLAVKVHMLWRWNFRYSQMTESYERSLSFLLGFSIDKLNLLGWATVPVRVAAHLVMIVDLQLRVKDQYERTAIALLELQKAFLFAPIPPRALQKDPLWQAFSARLLDPSEQQFFEEIYLRSVGGVVKIAEKLLLFLGELFLFLNLSALLIEACTFESYNDSWALSSLFVNASNVTERLFQDPAFLKERIREVQVPLEKWMGVECKFLLTFLESCTAAQEIGNALIPSQAALNYGMRSFSLFWEGLLGWRSPSFMRPVTNKPPKSYTPLLIKGS